MSFFKANNPDCDLKNCPDQLDMILIPRTADIGGMSVYRTLPSRQRRMVGPFVFWDQMGPGEFITGQGLDVRPHPHIGLSTLTYLFQGSLVHRDTLGSHQEITPGDVNLMTAGKGIAHSERTSFESRQSASSLFGLQCWLALPLLREEMPPTFAHHSSNNLPLLAEKDLEIRLISGSLFGQTSPVKVEYDSVFADCILKEGAKICFPKQTEERAIYSISGKLSIGGIFYDTTQMLILKPGIDVLIEAATDSRFILLGGAVMDGPRHMWWNFVSSSKERIQQAKLDWQAGHFGKIQGDSADFIPLPK
ncbi:pirin family protein [Candidatus Paracaedibacter symbiosus]|uniref:pirin family protein n=1 Tax=Candidatus Paracaedibacter symbiosus TaxID=244582 RepID=UPI0005095E46|nr:pirin family protein [Candidatus Paracaedibacter symbiosus]